MPDRPKSQAERAREQRLEDALRENLKRRKAQARARSDRPDPPHDSAGIPADKGVASSGEVGTGSPQKSR